MGPYQFLNRYDIGNPIPIISAIYFDFYSASSLFIYRRVRDDLIEKSSYPYSSGKDEKLLFQLRQREMGVSSSRSLISVHCGAADPVTLL